MAIAPRTLPDPFPRFAEVYQDLSQGQQSWAVLPWLRFAAYAAVLAPGEPPAIAQAIRTKADLLLRHAPWYGALASPLRFAIAACLVQNDCQIRRFEHQQTRMRTLLASEHLHPGGTTLALLTVIASIMADGKAISALHIARLAAIHHETQHHKWWRAGNEDLPSCLLLSYFPGTASVQVRHVEEIQQQLSTLGVPGGHAQRHTARLLLQLPLAPEQAVSRLGDLMRCYRERSGVFTPVSVELLSLLSALSQKPTEIIDGLMTMVGRVQGLEPQVVTDGIDVVAADLAFLSMVRVDALQQPLTTAAQHQEMFKRLRIHHAASLLLACEAMSEVMPTMAVDTSPGWPMAGP